MKAHTMRYWIHDVAPYINWIYFFHAWGFQPKFAQIATIHGCDACRASWIASFSEEERPKASEAMQLYKEAQRMIAMFDKEYSTFARFIIDDAQSVDDDIIVGSNIRIPLLRQQHSPSQGPNLCLSDFVAPSGSEKKSTIGLFATCADKRIEQLYKDDPYKRMLAQTCADRLAEATAELMHLQVRTHYWGYAPDEQLTIGQLHNEEFIGIRPAIGYPSLPDQSINFILDKALNYSEIGISLTENGAMIPHASTSGLMISHPKAAYFGIGKIGLDQLESYAKRRSMSVEEVKKFLIGHFEG